MGDPRSDSPDNRYRIRLRRRPSPRLLEARRRREVRQGDKMSIHDKYLDGSTKYDIAIKRIKSFCAGKRVLCAFSGGKDSQACYHLCKDAEIDFSAQYSITRFEPPELISFIRQNYPDVVFRRAFTRSLVDEIRVNGLPTRWHRFCCKAKHKKTPGFDIVVVGVRWEESPRRRDTWRMSGSKEDGVLAWWG